MGQRRIHFGKKTNSLTPPFNSYSITGNWDNATEAYIGIKLKDNQLGWLQISITQYGAHIHEYAILL